MAAGHIKQKVLVYMSKRENCEAGGGIQAGWVHSSKQTEGAFLDHSFRHLIWGSAAALAAHAAIQAGAADGTHADAAAAGSSGEAMGAQQADLGQGKHSLDDAGPVCADGHLEQVECGAGPDQGAQQAQHGAGGGVARGSRGDALLGRLQAGRGSRWWQKDWVYWVCWLNSRQDRHGSIITRGCYTL